MGGKKRTAQQIWRENLKKKQYHLFKFESESAFNN